MRRNLEELLRRGPDSALLRYSLGQVCLREQDTAAAITHLRAALDQDPGYSAAWRELGRAWLAAAQPRQAAEVWSQGVEAAQRRGDLQAAKEMQVFLRRVRRELEERPSEGGA